MTPMSDTPTQLLENDMSLETNKQTVVRFYEALMAADYDTVGSLMHPDFVFYAQIDSPKPGVAGFLAAERDHLEGAEATMKVEIMVAEGDRVAAYVVTEGIQITEYYGIPGNRAPFRFSMLNLFTFRDGLIIENRVHYNTLDIMNQIRSHS